MDFPLPCRIPCRKNMDFSTEKPCKSLKIADFQRFTSLFCRKIHVFSAGYSAGWKIHVLGPISHVEKPFFCCIFTNFARIKKINIDLKPPFEGGHGQLVRSGTWWHCGGILFHYRSIVDFQMMALLKALEFWNE